MAKNKNTGKGALAKDPSSSKKTDTTRNAAPTSTTPTKPKLTRLSPGVYRNEQGELTNSKGQRTDSRGRVMKNPPPAKEKAPKPTPPTKQRPPQTEEDKFRNMDIPKQDREVYEDAGSFYNQMVGNAMKFDPNNPGAGYQQAFTDQLNQARESVMGQFERSMAPQFEREQREFEQRMAERGIDPNSGAYQAQYKAMMDSQNNQRLNAQAQAFQLGGQYQQQGFEQATTGQMMPFQQWQAMQDPWKLQYAARQEAEQKERDRQAALQQARIGAGATTRSAQIAADASLNRANLDAINAGYPQNKPNIGNDIIRGVVAGGTAAALK